MKKIFGKVTGLIFLLSLLLTPQFASAIGFEVAAGIWNQGPIRRHTLQRRNPESRE